MEVTLREASLLCRKSEKTLRRKIEAGLLGGRREPLEFGGFMWLIDIDSLEDLYPGSRPSQLPALYNSPEPPQVRLRSRPQEEDSAERFPLAPRDLSQDSIEQALAEDDDDDEEDEDEANWSVRRGFFDYILDENRGLKLDLKERDARILNLNERAFILERALGEQEGKAATQSRVLEWFQSQESQREKQRAETERKLLEAPQVMAAAPARQSYVAALAGVAATLLLFLICVATGLVGFQV